MPRKEVTYPLPFNIGDLDSLLHQVARDASKSPHSYWKYQLDSNLFTKYIVHDDKGLMLGTFERDFILTGIDKILNHYLYHSDVFFVDEPSTKLYDLFSTFAKGMRSDADFRKELTSPLNNLSRANRYLTVQNSVLGLGIYLVHQGIDTDSFTAEMPLSLESNIYER